MDKEKKEKSKKEEEPPYRIRCKRCNSTFGYVRIKENTWKCRKCGHEQKLD